MNRQSYEDFKYVMMDTAFLYLGARYSYAELVENEDVPFKMRSVFERYIVPEMDPETTLESHFYHMDNKEFAYKTYRQLKIKVKVSKLVEKNGFLGLGKAKRVYTSEIIPLDKFVAVPGAQKEKDGFVIQEIVISKMALMGFVL